MYGEFTGGMKVVLEGGWRVFDGSVGMHETRRVYWSSQKSNLSSVAEVDELFMVVLEEGPGE